MKLSVVIPAHNEEGSIAETLTTLYEKLQQEKYACLYSLPHPIEKLRSTAAMRWWNG